MSAFHPLQTWPKSRRPAPVRCFLVIIHGAFRPRLNFGSEISAEGFYTTRWVVASNEKIAISKAVASARSELVEKQPDIRDGLVSIDMEAEEVESGSWWRWLKGGGRGFSFYTRE
jgi:hypothetical protein